MNRHHKGSNELPYDRLVQGAAHQAPQGSLNCLVTFELPSETFELPYDWVVHNAFHGAVHFWSLNNAIQQVPHALVQAGE